MDIFNKINSLPILEVLETLWIGTRMKWANRFLVKDDWKLDESFSISEKMNIVNDFGKTGIKWWVFDFIGRYCLHITEADMRTSEWRATTLKYFIDKGIIDAPEQKRVFTKSLSDKELLEGYDKYKLNGYKKEISALLMARWVPYEFIQKNTLLIWEIFADIGYYDNYFCSEYESFKNEDWEWQNRDGDKAKTVWVFMFPCYDIDKNLIWIKLRRKDWKTIRGKKSLAIGKTGLYWQKDINPQTMYIVEGEMDYIILAILGYKNIIANLGWVQSNKQRLKSLLYETKDIVCLYDNDTAGYLTKRELAGLIGRPIYDIVYPIREDSKWVLLTDINDYYKVGYDTKVKWDKIFAEKKPIWDDEEVSKQKYPFIFLRRYLEYYDTDYDIIQSKTWIADLLWVKPSDISWMIKSHEIKTYDDLGYRE